MGAFLATPVTRKDSEFGGDAQFATSVYGSAAMQGWRVSMEDAHVALPSLKALVDGEGRSTQANCAEALEALRAMGVEDLGIYGVFDGHGSNAVSAWTAANLLSIFSEQLLGVRREVAASGAALPRGATRCGPAPTASFLTSDASVICQAIEDTFLAIDCKLRESESREALSCFYEKGRLEQEGKETYLEYYLRNGGGGCLDEDGYKIIRVSLDDPPCASHQNEEPQVEELDDDDGEDTLKKGEVSEGGAAPASERLSRLDSTRDGFEKAEAVARKKDSPQQQQQPHPEAQTAEPPPPSESSDGESADCESEVSGALEATPTPPAGDAASTQETHSQQSGLTSELDSVLDDDGEEPPPSFVREHPHPSSPEGSGATSVVVVIVGGKQPSLVVANAGDSRAVLCRGGVAVALTHDHKPTNPDERSRIEAAGGAVTNGRVDGNLNLSRSLGDLFYKSESGIPPEKQRISAFPDVRITPICREDEFVILACDGIWDCKTNQEAVDFVKEFVARSTKPREEALRDACEALCDDCLSEDPLRSEGHGCDNMTVVVVEIGSKLREQGPEAAAQQIVLYGGGEDLYLGKEEPDYEGDED